MALFYLATFPHVPMILDSPEVVLQSSLVGVMHPPGYPLEVLYNALFIHALPFVSPLIASGLAHIVLGLTTIFMLTLLACEVAGAWGYALGLSLASAPLFWQYSTTPEVFIGLQLFAMAFIWLLHRPTLYTCAPFVLLLAMSVLHHHTVILFLPVLAWAAWEQRLNYRAHAVAVLCGIICLAAYGLLFFMHPDGLYSWGNISSLKNLWHHFLRAEYGTFSLARSAGATTLWERTALAGHTVFMNSLFPLALILWASWEHKAKAWGRFQVFLATLLVVYFCLFTWTGSVPFSAAGVEVYKRFFLLPVVMIHALAASMFHGKLSKNQIAVLLAYLVGTMILHQTEIWEEVGSGRREIAAQFHRDFLEAQPREAVVNIQGDSSFFATSYYQAVEKIRPDLMIVPFTVLQWRYDKLVKSYPGALRDLFTTSNPVALVTYNRPYVEFGSRLTNTPDFTVIKRDFVHQVFPGEHKLVFACDPQGPHYTGPDFPLRTFYFQSTLVNNYGLCDLLKGLNQLNRGLDAGALSSFEMALKKNPWHIHAQERKCFVLKKLGKDASNCQKRLELLLENTHEKFYGANRFPVAPLDLKIEWEPVHAN